MPRLLATAQQQDPPFDEIIVCVDSSPDRTAEIAKAWGVRVLVNKQNLGCSRSKNRTLEAASADWVHFHDADDVLLPTFTAEAHRWMAMKDAPDVVIMGFEYRDFVTLELLATGLVDDAALASDPIGFSISCKLPNFGIYRRDKLVRVNGFDCDASVLYNEDVAFHTKLALAGFRFRASALITSINWRHQESMSAENVVRCQMAHYAVMGKVAECAHSRYLEGISRNMWLAAQGLAMHDEWEKVDLVLAEAQRIFGRVPSAMSRDFTLICRVFGPHFAFRLREKYIRWFKPHLRRTKCHVETSKGA